MKMSSYLTVRGVIAVALGIFALLSPTMSLKLLVTIAGVFCIVDGLLTLLFSRRTFGVGGYTAHGLVTLVIGAVLVLWPEGTLRFLLIVLGLWLVIVGVNNVLTARSLQAEYSFRSVSGVSGAIVAILGLVLVVWPGTGIVAISWLLALAAIVYGVMSMTLGAGLRRRI